MQPSPADAIEDGRQRFAERRDPPAVEIDEKKRISAALDGSELRGRHAVEQAIDLGQNAEPLGKGEELGDRWKPKLRRFLDQGFEAVCSAALNVGDRLQRCVDCRPHVRQKNLGPIALEKQGNG